MRIALVGAPYLANAGMFSVDVSALQFFRNRDASVELDVYIAQPSPHLKPLVLVPKLARYTIKPKATVFGGVPGRAKRLTSSSQLLTYDIVIFWGDYINNPVFGSGDFSGRDVRWGYSTTRDEAFSRWRSLFCGSGLGDRVVISAGNNFQHKFEKPHHLEAISDMFANFDYIFPRDEHSCTNLD